MTNVTTVPSEPAALLALAVDLARRAGDLAAQGRRRGLSTPDTKSSPTDMVTEFDRASESLIVSGLRAARPDDGIVGEEGANVAGTSGIEWFIDPIDGTTNYLYGQPSWAVSIAAADASGTIIGVVHAPVLAETFTAMRGRGAQLNGAAVAVSTTTELAIALVATGFSYRATMRAAQGALAHHVLPRVRDIRRLGSAALDLCFVACGRSDAYYEEGLNAWDSAAGALIANEAGATVVDFGGGPARSDRVVACTPAIAAALLATLRDGGAPIG